MKITRIAHAVGSIDDDLIQGAAVSSRTAKNKAWIKWASLAACFAVIIVAIVFTLPMLLENDNPVVPSVGDTGIGDDNTVASPDDDMGKENEYKYESGYFYQVDEGAYSSYVGGKVISENRIRDKLTDVTLTAGWKNSQNEWVSKENLRGVLYAIDGVSTNVAVALRFVDKGEAVTTTHYYVIMNPQADLSSVEDYIITPVTPNNPGEEAGEEVLE